MKPTTALANPHGRPHRRERGQVAPRQPVWIARLCWCLATFLPSPGWAEIAITEDTTWRAADSPHTLAENVTVAPTAILTIEPGTTVQFRRQRGLTIQGQLLAEGTPEYPIRFTRHPEDPNWERLQFVDAQPSRLKHCVIEYANCVGDHKDYYDDDCDPATPPKPRTYHEAVVVLASHVDFDFCAFTNLPNASASAEGDALAIISDDPQNPGPASANVRNCLFVRIGQGVHTRFSYVLVEGCQFRDKHGDNDDVDLYGESSPAPLIRSNLFLSPAYDDRINPTRCSAWIVGNTIYGSSDHGIVLRDVSRPIVANNLLYNCSAGGIAIQNGCEALIVNNTLVNCPRAIKLFDHLDRIKPPYCLTPASGKAILLNNILWNSTPAFDLSGNAFGNLAVYVSHSCIQGGTQNAVLSARATLTAGPGILQSDPLFIAATSTNFRLRAESPVIDAGTNLIHFEDLPASLITTDLDGQPRPRDGDGQLGPAYDLGAFEFWPASTADFVITGLAASGRISWAGAFPTGVVGIAAATHVTGPWHWQDNHFTTTSSGTASVPWTGGNRFFRLLSADLSTQNPHHFTNLLQSYGLLETLAGTNLPGGGRDKSNYWRPWYEGGLATQAVLSRPHLALADPANNIIIVDQGSGSVLKVTPQGTIHTIAGTHTNSTVTTDEPSPATHVNLNFPNGAWMRDDGTLYLLDTENHRIRRLDPHGLMTTLVPHADTAKEGRGLWVKSDESVLYFCALTRLRKWTPREGVVTLTNVFQNLANIVGDERTGDLFICDRGAHRIYRLTAAGVLTPFAGNGTTSPRQDDVPALEFGFNRPRDLCFLPNGGYLVCEHDPGNCVWYVDPAGLVHLWLKGNADNNAYAGDGAWFYSDPALPKVSKVRSVRLDRRGNLILVENDVGYVRRIRFQPHRP
jgi:parallel beta-helix repeat protein